jgi:hypothetical protein
MMASTTAAEHFWHQGGPKGRLLYIPYILNIPPRADKNKAADTALNKMKHTFNKLVIGMVALENR